MEQDHFDPKGKGPSEFTITKWEELKNTLPFEDKLDFEEQKRGFIAAPDYTQIMGEDGHVVWDIMGQPSFREVLREAYFYGAQGAIAVCDITSKESLNELRYWVKAMVATTGEVPIVFLGNKCDLKDEMRVSEDEIDLFAKKHGSPSFLTSAKTGHNVERAFTTLVEMILKHQ